ncbi:NADP-dependent oxidoreductase [Poseidonibacter antarcticus]|uniref:NADP-dependent oxidoreductase n=1 Tax=Poseidonibacter antarcticus TaxID=2478538 RepID=UPI000EF43D1E|nr:NADP-dependent oxidoreductase [Poseidonibacter antarcticus]
MKAIILEKAGSVENLVIKEIKEPTIQENEVLIEVKALSINPADVKIRATPEFVSAIYGDEDVILGWDISGIVKSVGSKVTKFKQGDKVFGMVNFPGRGNAYAQFVASPENHLTKIPENMSFEQAAATTLAALTALQALENNIKKDDRILIHAGSGGVGHFAIQIAKHLGAYVITTSSAKNKDFVMSLGADEHIDYRSQAFEEVVKDIDFVLDPMGGDTLEKSVKVMKENGTIICLPQDKFSDELINEAKKKNVNIINILVQSSSKDMDTLAQLITDKKLKPAISKTFTFENMQDAHLEVEKGRSVGKVIVTL